MRTLIMCEGPNELAIVRILINSGLFIYSESDLLGLTPFHARQISTSGQVKAELNQYNDKVEIIRIGDKQSDTLKIPAEYKDKIISVKKFCTKPELEILLIIAEGLWDEYIKVKSKVKPKEFAKKNISINGKRYDNSTEFYNLYFADRQRLLCDVIRKYHKLNKSHAKDEGYLAELLK